MSRANKTKQRKRRVSFLMNYKAGKLEDIKIFRGSRLIKPVHLTEFEKKLYIASTWENMTVRNFYAVADLQKCQTPDVQMKFSCDTVKNQNTN